MGKPREGSYIITEFRMNDTLPKLCIIVSAKCNTLGVYKGHELCVDTVTLATGMDSLLIFEPTVN